MKTEQMIEELVRNHYKSVKEALLKEEIRRGNEETQFDMDLEGSQLGGKP